METFDCGKLFNSVVFLSNLAHAGHHSLPNAIPLREYQQMKDDIDLICAELGRLELPNSLASSMELRTIIYDEAQEQTDNRVPSGRSMRFVPLTFARYQKYAEYLVTRLKDELSAKMVMTFPNDKATYFNESDAIFSVKARNKFPTTQHDMAEAAKCFAFGRYTACVFHLMRVMETATQQLGAKLGVSLTKEKNWQPILDEVNKAIRKLNQKDPSTKKYAAVAALLENVKLAWRNEVMHPKEIYSEEDAKRIFSAVRSFLDKLASLI